GGDAVSLSGAQVYSSGPPDRAWTAGDAPAAAQPSALAAPAAAAAESVRMMVHASVNPFLGNRWPGDGVTLDASARRAEGRTGESRQVWVSDARRVLPGPLTRPGQHLLLALLRLLTAAQPQAERVARQNGGITVGPQVAGLGLERAAPRDPRLHAVAGGDHVDQRPRPAERSPLTAHRGEPAIQELSQALAQTRAWPRRPVVRRNGKRARRLRVPPVRDRRGQGVGRSQHSHGGVEHVDPVDGGLEVDRGPARVPVLTDNDAGAK